MDYNSLEFNLTPHLLLLHPPFPLVSRGVYIRQRKRVNHEMLTVQLQSWKQKVDFQTESLRHCLTLSYVRFFFFYPDNFSVAYNKHWVGGRGFSWEHKELRRGAFYEERVWLREIMFPNIS